MAVGVGVGVGLGVGETVSSVGLGVGEPPPGRHPVRAAATTAASESATAALRANVKSVISVRLL
jgi:hypothetical protein